MSSRAKRHVIPSEAPRHPERQRGILCDVIVAGFAASRATSSLLDLRAQLYVMRDRLPGHDRRSLADARDDKLLCDYRWRRPARDRRQIAQLEGRLDQRRERDLRVFVLLRRVGLV
jgi:hypothetical protein